MYENYYKWTQRGEKWGYRNKNEYSCPLSFAKYGILPILGKFGANFGAPKAQFWGNL